VKLRLGGTKELGFDGMSMYPYESQRSSLKNQNAAAERPNRSGKV